MNISEMVGERIRAVRSAKHLSQQALAEKAGISYKHIGEVERGQVNVSLNTLYKVAGAMGVEVCTLLVDLCERRFSEQHAKALTLLGMMDEKGVALACDLLEVVGRHKAE